MSERLRRYIAYLEGVDVCALSGAEREALCARVLVQIGFFQHERQIHLLVTLAFAVMLLVAVLFSALAPGVLPLALAGLLLVLLIPYVIHYYILENGVQKLYRLYDQLES